MQGCGIRDDSFHVCHLAYFSGETIDVSICNGKLIAFQVEVVFCCLLENDFSLVVWTSQTALVYSWSHSFTPIIH